MQEPARPHAIVRQQLEPEAEVDLSAIFARVWVNWKFVLVCGLIAMVAAWVAGRLMVPSYALDMVVKPVGTTGPSSSSALRALGVLQESPEESNLQELKLMLSSGQLADALMGEPKIAHQVFEREWDAKTGTWHQPQGLASLVKGWFLRMNGMPAWQPPTVERMRAYLRRRVSASTDRETGHLTVTYSYKDPQFARSFLLETYRISDEILRKQRREALDTYATYISRRVGGVTVEAYRAQLVSLLVDIERRRMLVESNTPFAGEILDPPVIPALPSSPQPLLLMIAGLVAGLCAGGAISQYFKGPVRLGRTSRGGD